MECKCRTKNEQLNNVVENNFPAIKRNREITDFYIENTSLIKMRCVHKLFQCGEIMYKNEWLFLIYIRSESSHIFFIIILINKHFIDLNWIQCHSTCNCCIACHSHSYHTIPWRQKRHISWKGKFSLRFIILAKWKERKKLSLTLIDKYFIAHHNIVNGCKKFQVIYSICVGWLEKKEIQ